MQSLGLSGSTPRSESRLKALFWPSIQNETDVDYLGQQGFWLCLVVAATVVIGGVSRGGVSFIVAACSAAFYLLGGMGIRERSQYAAMAVFAIYTLATIATSRTLHQFPGVLSFVIVALLLANIRATWLAATSQFSREAFDQDRLDSTLLDKITDQWPAKLWPFLQWLFWILFALEVLLTGLLLALPVLLPILRLAKHR